MNYQLLSNSNCVQRTDSNGVVVFIPNDPANRDWQAYQAWLAQGNTPQAPSA